MPDPLKKPAKASSKYQTSASFWQRNQFWMLILLASIIRQVPIISIPFNWLESYFHEISHGLAALLSGGSILSIQLFANGAGLCTTQGGSRFLISFFGYGGAIFWGAFIYLLAFAHQRVAQLLAAFIVLLIASSIVLWARDFLTIVILLVLLFLFVSTFKMKQIAFLHSSLPLMMKLIACLVLLNSLFSPLYLLDGQNLGDGAALAELTFIPELIWVGIWSGLALIVIYYLSKLSKKVLKQST